MKETHRENNDEIVAAPDLLAAIRRVFGGSTRVSIADMQRLTTLALPLKRISDLTGLEYARNLTQLRLVGNYIRDLGPIASLTQLTRLDLDGNYISDLSPLSGLTRLIELGLDGNLVVDTSPIFRLKHNGRLTYVDIAVSEYSPWDVRR